MYCRFCGAENPNESVFCKKCGARIGEELLDSRSEVVPVDKSPSGSQKTCDSDAAAENTVQDSAGQADLYKRLKMLEANDRDDTVEYHTLMKQEKKAYFWYKLASFAVVVSGYFFTQGILGDMEPAQKAPFLVIGVAVAALMFFGFSRIQKITGIRVAFNFSGLFSERTEEEEAAEEKAVDAGSDYFTRCLKKRHPSAIRAVTVLMGISAALSVICLIVCIGEGTGFWKSLCLALSLLYELGSVIYGIWAFKLGVFLVLIALGGILALLPESEGTSSPAENVPPYSIDSQAPQYAQESDCVTLNGARLDEDDGRTILVISYTWTNLTDSATSAAYSVSIHAYQNDVELEKAYFAEINDELWTRNVKPGAAIDLEVAFYIDDTFSDVSVEVTPWIALNGEIYTSRVYTWS